MKAYVVAFTVVAFALFALGSAGYEYLAVASLVSGYWLLVTFKPVTQQNYESWARSVFKISLLVVMSISGVLGMELLPLSI